MSDGVTLPPAARPRGFMPDRWLVPSQPTWQSLRDVWAEDALPGGLYRLRLARGYLAWQPLSGLQARLEEMAEVGVARTYVVLDTLHEDGLAALQAIAMQLAPRLELRVFEWRSEVPAVLTSLAVPDRQLLQAVMQAHGRALRPAPRPALAPAPAAEPSARSARSSAPPDWPEYEAALRAWELTARAAHGAGFEAVYGQDPIPWRDLAGWAGTEADAEAEAEADAGASRSGREAANDAAWTEVSLQPLAAQSAPDPSAPLQRRPPPGSAERWSLGRYPVDGEDAVYLILKVDADCLADYIGRRVQVLAEGRLHDLGVIQSDGAAECRVSGSVDITEAVVRLSPVPKDVPR